jgi:hypothetical protein
MASKPLMQRKGLRQLHAAANAVKRLFGRSAKSIENAKENEPQTQPSPRPQPVSANTFAPQRRVEADIPLDVLDRTYIPERTSSKASFRSDGRDHQRDQEFAFGVADERWNDEDHFTNKTGDPRIGTHRRAYEPGESREESRE